MQGAPLIMVRNRAELRDWMAANHATSGTVWIATYKRHHPDYLDWEGLVQELLCWGWIDSLPRAIDADRTGHLAAPRNTASAWSAVNKAHVERAIEAGAMTPAGLAKINAAKANGMWDFLNDVEALIDPSDLTDALQGRAAEVWAAHPRSVKRGTLEWIKMAKTPATRAARIAEVAASAAQGLRPKIFRR
jgi:uncharacterized protein YdeI (YjbR/CyaY-like superfamily)